MEFLNIVGNMNHFLYPEHVLKNYVDFHKSAHKIWNRNIFKHSHTFFENNILNKKHGHYLNLWTFF